ncbi:enoyl-CoA hydratase/isomerase family protein [Auritidibacter ignavus]|uniref:enoyl-CoA hydratase/isomerase family protein n=1 Tax=Auritidibacter ignavus TaxID=678932 RepID=UPI0024BBBEA5|nr:enoyl-CoA hydratase/isomerase family protein [Auritidibacter ignavus]WHS29026.1 enoyl-CoA hydratase/isomerase family protein [Auritidibacter ignavus]WHS35924.1 enoyl-CoA hydratase/isomerase family protein [Auritidibacter ignavus]
MIETSIDSNIGTVTLNAPERLNALSPQDFADFAAAVRELRTNEQVRVIIIQGAGDAFSSGLNLKALPFSDDGEPQINDDQVRAIYQTPVEIRAARQPVIAAVNGLVIGGAISLIGACDFRITTAQTRFRAPFGDLGLSGGDLGLSWFLPRLVGPTRAAQILLSGEWFTGADAAQWGLVTELVDDPQFRAQQLAQILVKKSRYSLEQTKRLLVSSVDTGVGLDAHLDDEIAVQAKAMRSPDFIEGAQAMMEKREPNFG